MCGNKKGGSVKKEENLRKNDTKAVDKKRKEAIGFFA